MNKYRVIFNFDLNNSITFFMDFESKEKLIYHIANHKDWFFHEDEKGVFHSVNMNLVTSISATHL